MQLPSLSALISCDAKLETQLTLAALQAVFWYVAIAIIAKLGAFYVKKQPWCQQWTTLNRSTFKKAFFVDFKTDPEAFDFACLFLGIIVQHAVGGLLCAPAVFGIGSTAVATTLACHGALCEVGWEIQGTPLLAPTWPWRHAMPNGRLRRAADVVSRAYQVIFGGPAGKEKNPTPLLVILAIHHTMGLSMAIPSALCPPNTPPKRRRGADRRRRSRAPRRWGRGGRAHEIPFGPSTHALPASRSEHPVRFGAVLSRAGLPSAVRRGRCAHLAELWL